MSLPKLDRHFWMVFSAGLVMGLCGVLLSVLGNPDNSGICVSCFMESSAGALGLHANQRMQYLRPELIGFVLGAALCAVAAREFRSRGGSAPLARLASGVFLIVGCAIFIGCPIKLFLRVTAGDLAAGAGFFGLLGGIWLGLKGLAGGVDLGRSQVERGGTGWLVPVGALLLLAFLLAPPPFVISSGRGSAAQHAPWLVSLGAGLLLGALAQRTRFCITGSVRDTLLMGARTPLLWGLLAFVVAAVVANVATGRFHLALYGQPGAHLDFLWGFLGMFLVGWLSILIGGCPFRQLVKAGEGDADAGLVVVGMLIGGGLVQSWGVAATAAGVPLVGKAAVLVGLAFVLGATLLFRLRSA